MERQRDAVRKPTLASAHILVNTSKPIECYIRDSTENGARIRLIDEKTVLPPGFRLRMPNGRIETAEVVWQSGASVGVRFLAPW
jgi:hypothetical protein